MGKKGKRGGGGGGGKPQGGGGEPSSTQNPPEAAAPAPAPAQQQQIEQTSVHTPAQPGPPGNVPLPGGNKKKKRGGKGQQAEGQVDEPPTGQKGGQRQDDTAISPGSSDFPLLGHPPGGMSQQGAPRGSQGGPPGYTDRGGSRGFDRGGPPGMVVRGRGAPPGLGRGSGIQRQYAGPPQGPQYAGPPQGPQYAGPPQGRQYAGPGQDFPPPGRAGGPPPQNIRPSSGAGASPQFPPPGQPQSFWAQQQQRQQGPQPKQTPQQGPQQKQTPQQGPPQQQAPPPQQQPVQQSSAPPAQQPRQDESRKPSPPKGKSVSEAVAELTLCGSGMNIPKRSQRDKAVKKGDRIYVETNHLALSIKNTDMVVFHYDVSVEPEKPFRFYRPALRAIQQKCYPNRHPAFDGKKNLYSYPELPINKKELCETVKVYDEEKQMHKDVTVTIKYANSVDLSVIKDYMRNGSSVNTPQEAVQALDIVLRQPAANKFVSVGRSFFTPPPGRVIPLGDGLDLWYGFFQSAILGWKPFLNIDVAHKGFPAPSQCLHFMAELCRCTMADLERPNFQLNQYQYKAFQDHLKGLKVICEIPENQIKRTYRVFGLSECPRRNRFVMEDKTTKRKQEMTVEEYFLQTYRRKLRFSHLPCVKAGTQEKPISLPAEFCRIVEGQVTMRKMNELQTRTMVKEAAVDTERRKGKIIKSMREIQFNNDPCIKEFGLTVADSFTKVEARILAAPTIDYKGRENRNSRVNVEKGVWRMSNQKFLLAADVSKWCILCATTRVRQDELNRLEEGLVVNGRECGLNIQAAHEKVYHDAPKNIEDYFRRCGQDGTKLIVVVLPDKGVSYATVKKMAELQIGVLTQCLKTATVQRRLNQATFVNILQKINAKLNGVNHNITNEMWPSFFSKPVMVVGADVTHPAPDQTAIPSIAAVAASHDPKAFKYNMIWKLQPPRVEVISELKEIMVEQLKFFYRNTRHKPSKILFYRDGVSEGQFRSILDRELVAIRAACQFLEAGYEPLITFLVVQKRHHTRFFPSAKDADGRNKNVPAGTVVDTEITHPTELDFYLVSHASIQGTARPTKYHLLWDDSNMSEQELQEITYYLCHLFTRCTRSVSYPAPTYYAHLAAFRARSYTEGEGVHLNLDDLNSEQEKRKISQEIVLKSPMFFV